MPRTDATAVEGICEVDDSIDLTPFIEAANALVTALLASAVNSSGSLIYNDVQLELIERWLSAHFYRIRDKATSSEGVRGVNESYQYKVGLFLSQTQYGQMAQVLDTAGLLAKQSMILEKGGLRRVGVKWVGKQPQNDAEVD